MKRTETELQTIIRDLVAEQGLIAVYQAVLKELAALWETTAK